MNSTPLGIMCEATGLQDGIQPLPPQSVIISTPGKAWR